MDKLYLKPVGGLCNRLRAIGSGTIVANKFGKRLVVFWGRDEFLNCKFSELFKPSEHFDVIEEKKWGGKKALFPYLPGSKPTSFLRRNLHTITCHLLNINEFIWFEELYQVLIQLIKDLTPDKLRSMKDFEIQSFILLENLLSKLHLPGNAFICNAWKLTPWQNYVEYFRPIEELQNQIDDLTFKFRDTVGVHIRRTDHSIAIQYSRPDSFIKAMKQEILDNLAIDFYLATDCSEIKNRIFNTFPNKVIASTNSNFDRNSIEGIKNSVIDLYALSNTKKILGSYFSSYSQVAAEIKGIKEVTIL